MSSQPADNPPQRNDATPEPTGPSVASLYRLAAAAAATGVARRTLGSAVDRGELPAERTGCGCPLVTLESVRAWAQRTADRGIGRPRSADPTE